MESAVPPAHRKKIGGAYKLWLAQLRTAFYPAAVARICFRLARRQI